MADAPDNTQSGFGGLMNFRDPDFLMNVGLGLMSAAKYGGNLGDGISGALNNYQAQKLRQQQIATGNISLSMMQQYQELMRRKMMGQGGPPQSIAPAVQPGQLPQPASPEQVSGYSLPGGVDPDLARMQGFMSGKPFAETEEGILKGQREQGRLQLEPWVEKIDSILKADNPAQAMTGTGNEAFIQHWPELAAAAGIDSRQNSNRNVQLALQNYRNQLTGSLGETAGAPPERYETVPTGYGGAVQIQQGSGKGSSLLPREIKYEKGEQVWDPATNTFRVPILNMGLPTGSNPFVTSPNSPQPSMPAAGGALSRGNASPAVGAEVGSQPLGLKAPTDEEKHVASLALDFRQGAKKLSALEARGITMPPTVRALITNVATTDDSGIFSQLLSQSALAALPRDQQTYMAALMPVLQGIGHNLGKARLTTSQVRQLLESAIPINTSNKESMDVVRRNRLGYYMGMLNESGNAIKQPMFSDSLGADYEGLTKNRPDIKPRTFGAQ